MGVEDEFGLVGIRIEVPVGPGKKAMQRRVTLLSLDFITYDSLEGSRQMS